MAAAIPKGAKPSVSPKVSTKAPSPFSVEAMALDKDRSTKEPTRIPMTQSPAKARKSQVGTPKIFCFIK